VWVEFDVQDEPKRRSPGRKQRLDCQRKLTVQAAIVSSVPPKVLAIARRLRLPRAGTPPPKPQSPRRMPKVTPVRFCGRSEMCPTNRRMFGCCAWSLLHNNKIGHSIGDRCDRDHTARSGVRIIPSVGPIFTCARPACVAECAISPARSAVTRHSACGRTGGPRLPFQANLLRFRAFPGRGLEGTIRPALRTLPCTDHGCWPSAPSGNWRGCEADRSAWRPRAVP
jgi:hypothetical protein